jgi:hypothetical protein
MRLTESLRDWQAVKAFARRVSSRSPKKKRNRGEEETATYVSAFNNPIALSIVVYMFTAIVIRAPE